MKIKLNMYIVYLVILIVIACAFFFMQRFRSEEISRKDLISRLYGREFSILPYVYDDLTVDKKNIIWDYFLNDSFLYFIESRCSNVNHGEIKAVDAEICMAYKHLKNNSDGSARGIDPLGIKELQYDNHGDVILDDTFPSSKAMKAMLSPCIKTREDASRILAQYIQFLNMPIPKLDPSDAN